jgi:predicted CoA-binding protein
MSDANHLGINVASGDACEPSPPGSGHAPDDAALASLLARVRTVAVVGLSPKPDRTSHQIAAWLLDHTPYEVYGVNPMAAGQIVLGHEVVATLAELPVVPDLVDVFRRSDDVPPVVDDAIGVGAGALWLQLGIVNEEAATKARAAGMTVVQNRCLKVEYARLRTAIVAGS